jgi:hypothetical protein
MLLVWLNDIDEVELSHRVMHHASIFLSHS